ncbi:hypothetical protein JTB14_038366 [Gonioctena quinquepunctata]|nr:hypothetical protein JTB14_038366 [Gonioctena quinquepunctata]
MPQCAVVGCNSTHRKTKGGSIRYHRFPGDSKTRHRWLQACGKQLNNCSTARICSRHFVDDSYERDVQHEILGLPTRCRLKKGAIPLKNLPTDFLKEEEIQESAYDILLAVGLVPTVQPTEKTSGGLPEDLNKMQIMEDVREGCNVQPSSPGHAEQRSDDSQPKSETNAEASFEENTTDDAGEAEKHENAIKDEKPETECNETAEVKAEPEVGEENYSNASSPNAESNKRKSENDDLPIKRLRAEIHENFASRDKILNEFIEMAECNNLEQLHSFSEQLLAEVKTLNELAKEKEREWNNIIHLKKLKEELLLRMQRKRQLLLINEKTDYSDLLNESQNDNTDDRLRNSLPQSILKMNLTNPRSALRIPNQNSYEMNGSADFRQGKRHTLDVQSIIADYRQRHPEAVPRRGRRIRQADGTHKYPNSILNFSSMALGSGSQVRQGSDVSNELNLLLNTMNMNRHEGGRPPNIDSPLPNTKDGVSFKDMLVQFARLSQSERNELIQNAIKPPPPYPEVTVHPVPTTSATTVPAAPVNSLLHGILTKTPPKQTTKTSFSPTLARLLTAPERAANNHATSTPTVANNTTIHPSNMSISEILSSSKAHNEITITPVDTQFETTPTKGRNAEEEEDSADRLVIDENNEAIDARKQPTDNNSEADEEVPPCQGCNQKAAQFVCAGCGNQWYCSRDCQVSAWDEHSEVCSG